MTFSEFETFIDELDRLFQTRNTLNFSERERIFARVIKLNEELGELCDEILAKEGAQRSEKLQTKNKDTLDREFADVVITLFLLAKALKIDVLSALEKSAKKVSSRMHPDL